MKYTKFFLLTLATLFVQSLWAQPGSLFTGGSVSFFIQHKPGNALATFPSNINEKTKTQYRISPLIGKKLNKHWRAGLQFSYFSYREKTIYTGIIDTLGQTKGSLSKNTNARAGLFAFYLINPEDQLNFYLFPIVQYTRGKNSYSSTSSTNTSSTKSSTLGSQLKLGALYRLNPHWELYANIASINFSHTTTKDSSPTADPDMEPQIDNSLSVYFTPSAFQFGALFHF